MKFLASLFLFFLQVEMYSQNHFEVVVKDSTSNELLVGVNVVFAGTNIGVTTDNNGFAKLSNIPTGHGIIEFSYIGYKKKTMKCSFPIQNIQFPVEVFLSPAAEEVEEVTISATRNNSRIEELPTKIEVLGLDDTQEENSIKPGNITSLLGDIGGIQMQQTSASSGNINARIQGLNGRYSQILKDGMPLYGGFSGSFSILQVPPIDLKQIEIIKGSASTLFGGDAIGGIINLVSKNPTLKPETNILFNQTTLKETDVNTYISRKYNKVGFTFFAGSVYQKPVDVNSDGLSDVPYIQNFVIHPKLFYYFDENTTLSAGFNGVYENRQGGDMQVIEHAQTVDHLYFVSHKSRRNSLELNINRKTGGGSNINFKASSSFLNRSIESNSFFFSAKQNLYFSELSYFLKKEKTDFVFGLNLNGDVFTKEKADSIYVSNYNYSTTGFFVQNDLKLTEKLLIESGFRIDRHATFGNFYLPRLSIMYKFLPDFTVRLNGGLGYKIPVLFGYIDEETDLVHLQENMPALEAEKSQGINFDINYSSTFLQSVNLTLNQSFFYTILNKPVVYSINGNSNVELKNASKPVETLGFQSYMRLAYDELELYLSYVYTHAQKKYDPSNPWFLATPEHNLATTAAYEFSKNWRCGIEGSWVGRQYIENYAKTPSYLFMAFMIQRNIKKLSIVLNCENLLDYRQKDFVIPPISKPTFKTLWAPIDGRVINLSLNLKL